MNSYHVIDMETWPRREMFDFYQKFSDPCINVSVALEAEPLSVYAKERKESFFLMALYAILRAANSVPQMRQRIVDGKVVEFERIAVMTPIMTEQEMFRQIWCEYADTYDVFAKVAGPMAEAAKRDKPSPMEDHGDDFLCASCVPWLHFTSITQAERFFGQAIPILGWGKLKNGVIPISCKFNHSFLDGLHISRFFESIENSFADPESLWRPV